MHPGAVKSPYFLTFDLRFNYNKQLTAQKCSGENPRVKSIREEVKNNAQYVSAEEKTKKKGARLQKTHEDSERQARPRAQALERPQETERLVVTA